MTSDTNPENHNIAVNADNHDHNNVNNSDLVIMVNDFNHRTASWIDIGLYHIYTFFKIFNFKDFDQARKYPNDKNRQKLLYVLYLLHSLVALINTCIYWQDYEPQSQNIVFIFKVLFFSISGAFIWSGGFNLISVLSVFSAPLIFLNEIEQDDCIQYAMVIIPLSHLLFEGIVKIMEGFFVIGGTELFAYGYVSYNTWVADVCARDFLVVIDVLGYVIYGVLLLNLIWKLCRRRTLSFKGLF